MVPVIESAPDKYGLFLLFVGDTHTDASRLLFIMFAWEYFELPLMGAEVDLIAAVGDPWLQELHGRIAVVFAS